MTLLGGAHATLDAALAAAAEQFGERDAYVDAGDRLSYTAWVREADSVAAALVDRGVRPGDLVALLLPSSTDYAVCVAACVRLGAVVSGINPRLGPSEMDAIARSGITLVVRDLALPCGPGLAALPTLDRAELASLRAAARAFEPGPRKPTDLVTVIWTSGTTGEPKGACFDHLALRAHVGSAGVMAAPYDRRLLPTPLPHAGYMAKLWEQVGWGMTLVLTPVPWTVDGMLDLLERERITVCGGVPTQFAMLLRSSRCVDTSSLRLAVMATAPAPPELVRGVQERLGCPVVVRYAMTECPSITGTDPSDSAELLFRTVGRPQAGVQLEVLAPPGEVGRVRVRSAGAMTRYWHGGGVDREGWVCSTDLGRLDADGNLVLVGRESEMYVRGGYNVHPQEVEAVLRLHPSVVAAAVVGTPADVIGEVGVAFVVASAPVGLEELRAWCGERLADYKRPDALVVLDELPLTSMLKVDRAALRARTKEE